MRHLIGLVSPRYYLELSVFIIFVSIALAALVLGEEQRVVPILLLYAVAGYKLLPAFNSLYASLGSIRHNRRPIESLLNCVSSIPINLNSKKYRSEAKPGNQDFTKEIRLEKIYFYYPGDSLPTLESLSTSIPFGKFVGIVGDSGSGKTTLVNLLLGLLKPQSGRIFVDEREIFHPSQMPSVGYVPQQLFVSRGSIAENILIGRNSFSQADVRKAAKMAQLDDFVSALPDGYNTLVGQDGSWLSGGQRQRLVIARALLSDPKILVLDESTSGLEDETSNKIFGTLDLLKVDKTIIIVSHSKSAVEKCDIIIRI
jgi:ABC-type bacteriocin/lantibiotic exporter with double-glycine peptidase domain